MEIVFLVILIITMIAALASGFPVAFALPGSAIVSITLAAIFGYVFEGVELVIFLCMNPTVSWWDTNFSDNYYSLMRI